MMVLRCCERWLPQVMTSTKSAMIRMVQSDPNETPPQLLVQERWQYIAVPFGQTPGNEAKCWQRRAPATPGSEHEK